MKRSLSNSPNTGCSVPAPKSGVECPKIETMQQAIDIGLALSKVLRMDPGWASNVFASASTFNRSTGPDALNEELQDMWLRYMSQNEQHELIKQFVIIRLSR